MLRRERLLKAFNNEEVDRPPVGFWFHFVQEEDFSKGLQNPDLLNQNLAGHQQFIEEIQPDFVKIMSDGYFFYPREEYNHINEAKDLKNIKPLAKDHVWFKDQVKIVKTVIGYLNGTCGFYNVFSPAKSLQLAISGEKFIEFFKEDKEAVSYALDVIAHDLINLVELIIQEAGADGIYLSVQNPKNGSLSYEEYRNYITPSEKSVLEHANKLSENNILHCCGYEGNRNNLEVWKDYQAKAVNWAMHIENVNLKEGKEFFGGKAVIGGFDNRPGKLLHAGTKQEIEEYTEKLIAQSGSKGVILGADCTVPSDIHKDRIRWVRDKVVSMM